GGVAESRVGTIDPENSLPVIATTGGLDRDRGWEIFNQTVERHGSPRTGPGRGLRSHPEGHPPPAEAGPGEGHRRRLALPDVAERGVQAPQGARGRGAAAPGAPGAGAHAGAERGAPPGGGPMGAPVRALLERAARSARGILCRQEGEETMKYTPPKQTELTLSRTIAPPPGAGFDVWMDPKSPGGPGFAATQTLPDAQAAGAS